MTDWAHSDTITAMHAPEPASMTLRLPLHIRHAIGRLAQRYGVGVTDIVRMAIAEYLEERGALQDIEESEEDELQAQGRATDRGGPAPARGP